MSTIHIGGFRFYADLLNKINALNTSTVTGGSGLTGESVQIHQEFIRVKSYVNDRLSITIKERSLIVDR